MSAPTTLAITLEPPGGSPDRQAHRPGDRQRQARQPLGATTRITSAHEKFNGASRVRERAALRSSRRHPGTGARKPARGENPMKFSTLMLSAVAAAALAATGFAGASELRQGRNDRHRWRRADVPVQEHHPERGQLQGPHHAGRRGQGRRPGRHPVRPRAVHRVRADQRRLRQAPRRYRRYAAEAREQGPAGRRPHLPRASRPLYRQGPDGHGQEGRRQGHAQDRRGRTS